MDALRALPHLLNDEVVDVIVHFSEQKVASPLEMGFLPVFYLQVPKVVEKQLFFDAVVDVVDVHRD